MHQSTWVILLFLMAGEIVILAIGGFVLWLVGEFGDAPKWLRIAPSAQGPQGAIAQACQRARPVVANGACEARRLDRRGSIQ